MQTLLHPFTEKELDILTAATPHAIHVTGPKGIGLRQVAKEFADRINAFQNANEPGKLLSVEDVVNGGAGTDTLVLVNAYVAASGSPVAEKKPSAGLPSSVSTTMRWPLVDNFLPA